MPVLFFWASLIFSVASVACWQFPSCSGSLVPAVAQPSGHACGWMMNTAAVSVPPVITAMRLSPAWPTLVPTLKKKRTSPNAHSLPGSYIFLCHHIMNRKRVYAPIASKDRIFNISEISPNGPSLMLAIVGIHCVKKASTTCNISVSNFLMEGSLCGLFFRRFHL